MKKYLSVLWILMIMPLWASADTIHTVGLSVAGHPICAEVSNTTALQEKGLSGHAPLTDQQGMVFVYSDSAIRDFWMHQMTFPLDIIWVSSDHTIAGISANLPICLPGTQCVVYSSPKPVKYVLEVNAGLAKKWGLQVGDALKRLSSCPVQIAS